MNFEHWPKLNFVKKTEKKCVLLYAFKVIVNVCQFFECGETLCVWGVFVMLLNQDAAAKEFTVI